MIETFINRDRYASIKALIFEEIGLNRSHENQHLQGLFIAANHSFSNSIMRRFPIQILVTCLFLNSCASTNSPLISHPTHAAEVDTGESKFAVGASMLERAVLELPPEAVADIPRSQRAIFLSHLGADEPPNNRLDVKNGFLEFYTDGEVPFFANSMLYMKVFPKKDGGDIVFCHMPKPQADTLPPRPGQTYFFTQRDGKWVDVTKETLPRGVDILWLFRHSRNSLILQAGPYDVWKKPDGMKSYSGDAKRRLDLVWDRKSFHAQKAKSPTFDYGR
jgi:hypothetical protein